MRQAIIIILLFTASVASAVSYPISQTHKPSEETLLSVESTKAGQLLAPEGQPAIPKSWRMVGVTSGEKQNSSNLWFQADDGSIYLLQVFPSQNRLFFHDQIYKIPAK